jgi:hypothetical protein
MTEQSQAEIVAKHWDKKTSDARQLRTRWWESKTILRHVNKIVCGEPLDGPSAGLHSLLSKRCPNGYARGVL